MGNRLRGIKLNSSVLDVMRRPSTQSMLSQKSNQMSQQAMRDTFNMTGDSRSPGKSPRARHNPNVSRDPEQSSELYEQTKVFGTPPPLELTAQKISERSDSVQEDSVGSLNSSNSEDIHLGNSRTLADENQDQARSPRFGDNDDNQQDTFDSKANDASARKTKPRHRKRKGDRTNGKADGQTKSGSRNGEPPYAKQMTFETNDRRVGRKGSANNSAGDQNAEALGEAEATKSNEEQDLLNSQL